MEKLFSYKDTQYQSASIKVIIVGSPDSKMLENMIKYNLPVPEYVCANNGINALEKSLALASLGGKPSEVIDVLILVVGIEKSSNIKAALMIAQATKRHGILTVAVVTTPLIRKGKQKIYLAEKWIAELNQFADLVFTIPNQESVAICGTMKTEMQDVFCKNDNAAFLAVRGIIDVIQQIPFMSYDFAEIKALLSECHHQTRIGFAVASGENKASAAAKAALSSPLIKGINVQDAKGIFVNVTGNEDMLLTEYNEAVSVMYKWAGENANMICGTVYDLDMEDYIRVTVIVVTSGQQQRAVHQPPLL